VGRLDACLTAAEIIEWSKPLPLEQWAKRSSELELAIAQSEAELAMEQVADCPPLVNCPRTYLKLSQCLK
jgi:hypothetical protein